MPTLELLTSPLSAPELDDPLADAHRSAAAFLACIGEGLSMHTATNLRVFLAWAIDAGLDLPAPARPQTDL